MKRLPPADPYHGGQVGLPTMVEQLLIDVVADGFTLYCCGPKTAPNALVASYEWDHHIDLLTIRDFDRVSAARVPKRGTVDIFAPEVVVWSYQGPPQRALRVLLDLVHPAHPAAPTADYPAPASLRVPRAQQRPMTIQPPSPSRARVRADRLATAITPTVMIAPPPWPASAPGDGPNPSPYSPRSPAGCRLSGRPPDARLPAASRSPTDPS